MKYLAVLLVFVAGPALAQTVTPAPAQPGSGASPLQSPVFPPVESITGRPGNLGTPGTNPQAPDIVFPPAENLTRGPAQNQGVLPPVERLVPGAPGGFPATTPGTAANTPLGGVAATGVAPSTFFGDQAASTGFLVPPAFGTAQGTQAGTAGGGLFAGGQAELTSANTSGFFGFPTAQGPASGIDTTGGQRGGALIPQGTSPGSRPGAPEYIGAPLTPYDPDVPDALDFSRTP